MRLRRPSHRGLVVAGIVGVVALLTLSGYVAALSLTVTKGPTEHAIGTYVAGTNLGTWWTVQKFSTSTVPSGTVTPSNASSSPSVLPASGTVNYGLNGVFGAAALLWIFQVTTAAPTGQELELQLNYSFSGNTSRFVIFLGTPGVALSGLVSVRVYFATTSPILTGGTIQSVTEFTAKCISVGRCP